MAVTVYTCGLNGINANIVNIEADISNGLPSYDVVGLADTSVKESKERVRSGLKNSGFTFPARKITINLAPASIKKEGTHYDLPMAVALLKIMGAVDSCASDFAVFGELSLNGDVRGVSGILPMTDRAREAGFKKVIVPDENKNEASLVPNIEVYPVKNLNDAVNIINKETQILPYEFEESLNDTSYEKLDFADVAGQESAKRAIEVACSGGHSCIMSGPPGGGKTMLSKRIPSILPPLSYEEAMEVTKIYSVSGLITPQNPLIKNRPFRTVHHTASSVSLVGGGSKAMPGEVSLAHNGVLFLDEIPEFKRAALEVLRQPLEDKKVTVTRVSRTAVYPCNFMIVAAMNPCPCGYFGSDVKPCTCSNEEIRRYQRKISGPLFDRIDIQIEIPALKYNQLSDSNKAESSDIIRKRVTQAREIQEKRYKGSGIRTNAELTSPMIKEYCKLSNEANTVLRRAFDNLGLSARGYTKILKLARTIADMEKSENIEVYHIAEAISYRDMTTKYIR